MVHSPFVAVNMRAQFGDVARNVDPNVVRNALS